MTAMGNSSSLRSASQAFASPRYRHSMSKNLPPGDGRHQQGGNSRRKASLSSRLTLSESQRDYASKKPIRALASRTYRRGGLGEGKGHYFSRSRSRFRSSNEASKADACPRFRLQKSHNFVQSLLGQRRNLHQPRDSSSRSTAIVPLLPAQTVGAIPPESPPRPLELIFVR